MKKAVSAILAVCMLFCGVLVTTAGATFGMAEQSMSASYIGIMPLASEHLGGWSPVVNRNGYGAQVSFVGTRSGSIRVELQNSAGTTIASFTESFTNRNNISVARARSNPAGTYRIVIHVTIGGSTTTRTSNLIRI